MYQIMARQYKSDMSAEQKATRQEKDELCTRRKAAKKSCEHRFPGRGMEWENGKLLFSDTRERVPGSPIIEKKKPSTAPKPAEVTGDESFWFRLGYRQSA